MDERIYLIDLYDIYGELLDEKKKESGINLQPQEATQAIENYISVHGLPLLSPEEQAEMKKLQFYDPAKL